jgi:hypothetical protein
MKPSAPRFRVNRPVLPSVQQVRIGTNPERTCTSVGTQELLIPALSGLAGALIGGAATVWSQIVTHRGTARREREAREHAFMIKRYEIERDTLLALQDALLAHSRVFLQVARGQSLSGRESPPTELELLDELVTISKLVPRLLDDEARSLTTQYSLVAHQTLKHGFGTNEGANKMIGDVYSNAQEAIGAALRKDPFSN